MPPAFSWVSAAPTGKISAHAALNAFLAGRSFIRCPTAAADHHIISCHRHPGSAAAAAAPDCLYTIQRARRAKAYQHQAASWRRARWTRPRTTVSRKSMTASRAGRVSVRRPVVDGVVDDQGPRAEPLPQDRREPPGSVMCFTVVRRRPRGHGLRRGRVGIGWFVHGHQQHQSKAPLRLRLPRGLLEGDGREDYGGGGCPRIVSGAAAASPRRRCADSYPNKAVHESSRGAAPTPTKADRPRRAAARGGLPVLRCCELEVR